MSQKNHPNNVSPNRKDYLLKHIAELEELLAKGKFTPNTEKTATLKIGEDGIPILEKCVSKDDVKSEEDISSTKKLSQDKVVINDI